MILKQIRSYRKPLTALVVGAGLVFGGCKDSGKYVPSVTHEVTQEYRDFEKDKAVEEEVLSKPAVSSQSEYTLDRFLDALSSQRQPETKQELENLRKYWNHPDIDEEEKVDFTLAYENPEGFKEKYLKTSEDIKAYQYFKSKRLPDLIDEAKKDYETSELKEYEDAFWNIIPDNFEFSESDTLALWYYVARYDFDIGNIRF